MIQSDLVACGIILIALIVVVVSGVFAIAASISQTNEMRLYCDSKNGVLIRAPALTCIKKDIIL